MGNAAWHRLPVTATERYFGQLVQHLPEHCRLLIPLRATALCLCAGLQALCLLGLEKREPIRHKVSCSAVPCEICRARWFSFWSKWRSSHHCSNHVSTWIQPRKLLRG